MRTEENMVFQNPRKRKILKEEYGTEDLGSIHAKRKKNGHCLQQVKYMNMKVILEVKWEFEQAEQRWT